MYVLVLSFPYLALSLIAIRDYSGKSKYTATKSPSQKCPPRSIRSLFQISNASPPESSVHPPPHYYPIEKGAENRRSSYREKLMG